MINVKLAVFDELGRVKKTELVCCEEIKSAEDSDLLDSKHWSFGYIILSRNFDEGQCTLLRMALRNVKFV